MNKIAELEFTGKDLNERWNGVKEDFWGDLKAQTVIALKRLLETSMEIEIQDLIGAERWKHISPRPSFRNGHYFRNLLTTMGLVTLLKVPRLREGKKRFKVLPRYVQRAPDVDKGVLARTGWLEFRQDVCKKYLPLGWASPPSALAPSAKSVKYWIVRFKNFTGGDSAMITCIWSWTEFI